MRIIDFRNKAHTVEPKTEKIFPYVEDGVAANLELANIPDPIDSSLAAYRKEPKLTNGSRRDRFDTVDRVLRTKKADCEDFAAWAAAWLQRHGIPAHTALIWWGPGGGWHAVTWTPEVPEHWLEEMNGDGVYAVEDLKVLYPGAAGVYTVGGWNVPGYLVDMARHHGMRDHAWEREVSINAAYPEPKKEDAHYYDLISGARDEAVHNPASLSLVAVALGAVLAWGLHAGAGGTLPWSRLYPASFGREIASIAKALGTRPDWLMVVIWLESRFKLNAFNPDTGASGLIQWLPKTAIRLGTTVAHIRRMDWGQQAALIYKYLEPYKGRLGTLENLYAAVFRPKMIGREVWATKGEPAYDLNSGLDLDRDGRLTGKEAASKLQGFLEDKSIQGPSELDAYRREITSAATMRQAGSVLFKWATGTTDKGQRDALNRKGTQYTGYGDAPITGEFIQEMDRLAHILAGVETSYDPDWWETVKNAAAATGRAVVAPVSSAKTSAPEYERMTGQETRAGEWSQVGDTLPWIAGLALAGAVLMWRK